MANTYKLLSNQILGSTTASITFSAIPSTYTDLLIKVAARCDASTTVGDMKISFNGSTTTYSEQAIYTAGGAPGGTYVTSGTAIGATNSLEVTGATVTANTFGNAEIYIPSYTVAQKKPLYVTAITENNVATNGTLMTLAAGLWSTTAAITSINIALRVGSYIAGSSFQLYGIKNS